MYIKNDIYKSCLCFHTNISKKLIVHNSYNFKIKLLRLNGMATIFGNTGFTSLVRSSFNGKNNVNISTVLQINLKFLLYN